MISVTYSYTKISKADASVRNLDTQLHIMQEYGIREEHIFADLDDRQHHGTSCLERNDEPGPLRRL